MKWEQTEINLGSVKVKIKKDIVFQAIEDFKKIKSVASSCGCSVPMWEESSKKLIVTYTPSNIPQHLLKENKTEYTTKKSITLYYTDDSKETLVFTATVKK